MAIVKCPMCGADMTEFTPCYGTDANFVRCTKCGYQQEVNDDDFHFSIEQED